MNRRPRRPAGPVATAAPGDRGPAAPRVPPTGGCPVAQEPAAGAAAPEVRLQSADGSTFDLSAFRGRAAVLLFGMRAFG
jgi:cytochrome oxidase Cu insertion factor (SCO1/SenC/PrrC family)